MNALLLVFLISLTGAPQTFAVAFDSMAKCEAKRTELMMAATNAPISHIAMACVVPVMVQGT